MCTQQGASHERSSMVGTSSQDAFRFLLDAVEPGRLILDLRPYTLRSFFGEGFDDGSLGYVDTIPNVDTVGELVDAESGNLLRCKSSKMRDSRLLHFFSCYEVI